MPRLWILAAVLIAALLLPACAPINQPDPEGLAFYLPAEPLTGAQILKADLSSLRLQGQPIITQADIIWFDPRTGEMELTAAAVQRLVDLQVPVSGRGFVVTLNRQWLFPGAFWTYISSLAFEGITLMTPLSPELKVVRLGPGYPAPDGSAWPDPRQDQRLLDALRAAGKLRQDG